MRLPRTAVGEDPHRTPNRSRTATGTGEVVQQSLRHTRRRASQSEGGTLMAAQLANITFDCEDALKVARFWCAVLGRPLDRGSRQLFASIGGADADRTQPAWYFTKVPEAKQVKNRVHVDLTTPDPTAIDHFVALGATVVGEQEVPGGSHRWTSCKIRKATSSVSRRRASPAGREPPAWARTTARPRAVAAGFRPRCARGGGPP